MGRHQLPDAQRINVVLGQRHVSYIRERGAPGRISRVLRSTLDALYDAGLLEEVVKIPTESRQYSYLMKALQKGESNGA